MRKAEGMIAVNKHDKNKKEWMLKAGKKDNWWKEREKKRLYYALEDLVGISVKNKKSIYGRKVI